MVSKSDSARCWAGAGPSVASSRVANCCGSVGRAMIWASDRAPNGRPVVQYATCDAGHPQQQSAGMMVNYLYRLDDVEQNHEMYVRDSKVAASREIRRLAAECPLERSRSKH